MDSSFERKLKKLFDFQKFEKNPELLKIKEQTEDRFGKLLNEDDLALVNAAGEFDDKKTKLKLEDQ